MEAVSISGAFQLRSKFNFNDNAVTKLHSKQFLNPLRVRRGSHSEVGKVPFLLFGLLCEDVALVGMFPLDFSRSGKRETLF